MQDGTSDARRYEALVYRILDPYDHYYLNQKGYFPIDMSVVFQDVYELDAVIRHRPSFFKELGCSDNITPDMLARFMSATIYYELKIAMENGGNPIQEDKYTLVEYEWIRLNNIVEPIARAAGISYEGIIRFLTRDDPVSEAIDNSLELARAYMEKIHNMGTFPIHYGNGLVIISGTDYGPGYFDIPKEEQISIKNVCSSSFNILEENPNSGNYFRNVTVALFKNLGSVNKDILTAVENPMKLRENAWICLQNVSKFNLPSYKYYLRERDQG
jgi:hypothetical protein